jgi:DNA-binding response OmpR family regulator
MTISLLKWDIRRICRPGQAAYIGSNSEKNTSWRKKMNNNNAAGERLIIIVENNERTMAFVSSGVANADYRVISLKMLKLKKSSMMVLDMVMPGVGGFEFLRRLCQFSRLPVMVASNDGTGADTAISIEASDFPVDTMGTEAILNRVKGMMVTRRWDNRKSAINDLQMALCPVA